MQPRSTAPRSRYTEVYRRSIEAVVAAHPAVAECAVIELHDAPEGQRPSGYVVLESGADFDPETLRTELVTMVGDQIGPVATFRDVTIVAALPKTRSGKILRKIMRQIASREHYAVPSTLEDPSVLADPETVLATMRDPAHRRIDS